MRTIKCRGFNAKNGQWLFGFYLQNRGGHFVCPDEFANGKSWEDYEVNPDTIGQFTGLCDCKGREIYEGDICALDYQNGRMYMQVRWHEKDAHFGFQFKGENHIGCADAFGHWIDEGRVEVIGNIHDDPDFLKGGQND